jgi:amino acid permease
VLQGFGFPRTSPSRGDSGLFARMPTRTEIVAVEHVHIMSNVLMSVKFLFKFFPFPVFAPRYQQVAPSVSEDMERKIRKSFKKIFSTRLLLFNTCLYSGYV